MGDVFMMTEDEISLAARVKLPYANGKLDRHAKTRHTNNQQDTPTICQLQSICH